MSKTLVLTLAEAADQLAYAIEWHDLNYFEIKGGLMFLATMFDIEYKEAEEALDKATESA